MTILWETDQGAAENLRMALGAQVLVVDSGSAATRHLADDQRETLLVVGPDVDLTAALTVTEQLRVDRSDVGVVLMRRRLDLTVLSHSLRSGVREVVGADDLAGLTEACQRSVELSRRLAGNGDSTSKGDGRVITVFSAKGGVGKTTVSTNVAGELASDGSRVLLVDLDLAFGDVAICLGISPERSMSDIVAMSGHLDQRGLDSVVVSHDSGVEVLCAPSSPADADHIPAATVTELLHVAKGLYDYIVVDTPPAFDEHVLAAFDMSDVSILLATLDVPAVKNLRLTLDTLDLLGHPRESWVVVLNRANSKVGLTIDDVATALHRPIAVQIASSVSVPAAANRGVLLVLDDPRHPVSNAIKTLVRDYVRVSNRSLRAGETDSVAARRSDHRDLASAGRRFFRRSGA
jgi:pilus assembly protein CpaE